MRGYLALWHGGENYARPDYRDDLEWFPTIREATAEHWGRFALRFATTSPVTLDGDGYASIGAPTDANTPSVHGSTMRLWAHDTNQPASYPLDSFAHDILIVQGPRGSVYHTRDLTDTDTKARRY